MIENNPNYKLIKKFKINVKKNFNNTKVRKNHLITVQKFQKSEKINTLISNGTDFFEPRRK